MDHPNLLKLAVLIRTYKRKNGLSKGYLKRAFKSLENQTYKNFKLFVIGDDYSDNEEFEDICKSYNGDIYYYNNPESFRTYNFKVKQNYWSVGGGKAMIYAQNKVITENYDYYFHLDDDDTWQPNHVEIVVKYINRFPKVDVLYSKSMYRDGYLPYYHESEENVAYNNFPLKPAHSVHSSHVYNVKTLGNVLIGILLHLQRQADIINNKNKDQYKNKNNIEYYNRNADSYKVDLKKYKSISDGYEYKEKIIEAGDASKARIVGNTNKYNNIYIPLYTVNKYSDGNTPDIHGDNYKIDLRKYKNIDQYKDYQLKNQ